MKRRAGRMTGFVVLAMLMAAVFCVPGEAFEIQIDVAPNVLNLQSQSTVVTVHTDIPYGDVKGASVFLNDVAIAWWKVDNRGYFVAKFNADEIKTLSGLIIGEYNELTLTGYTVNGEAFIGKQPILVVDNVPARKS